MNASKSKIIFVSCLAVFFICCKTVARESDEDGQERKDVIKDIQAYITCTDTSPELLRIFSGSKSWKFCFVCKKLISFYYSEEGYLGGADGYC